jgi:hypothetical protein
MMSLAADFYIRALASLQNRAVLQAIEDYNSAERLGYDPGLCSAGRWEAFMLLGLFEKAWQESDRITRIGDPDPHRLWDGQQSFTGKRIIIRCLHGLGDAIQFLRYVKPLKVQAEFVAVETPRRLMPLAAPLDGVDSVVSWEVPGQHYPDWDLHIEVMQLPYAFRSTLETLPRDVPYFHLPPQATPPLGRKPKIGIVWAASDWDISRSLPLNQLIPLLELTQFEFCAVQIGEKRKELLELPKKLTLQDATHEPKDLLEAAESVCKLDLLISVDTMMAHLAGSLSVPVWLLLNPAANWRWLMGRRDCPWYPSLRIFRRSALQCWSDVVDELRLCLLQTYS